MLTRLRDAIDKDEHDVAIGLTDVLAVRLGVSPVEVEDTYGRR